LVSRVSDFGFGISGFGVRVSSFASGSRVKIFVVQVSCLRVGVGVWSFGYQICQGSLPAPCRDPPAVIGFGLRGLCLEFQVSGLVFMVSNFGCQFQVGDLSLGRRV